MAAQIYDEEEWEEFVEEFSRLDNQYYEIDDQLMADAEAYLGKQKEFA